MRRKRSSFGIETHKEGRYIGRMKIIGLLDRQGEKG